VNPFGGYDAFEGQDPYCYEGTTVLRNLLDIHDAATLEAFELEMSTLRAAEPLPEGAFNSDHYKQVHHHLFQDVYAWAGVPRTIQTSKGGNLFCLPAYINAQLETLFSIWANDAGEWCQTAQQFVVDVADSWPS
jgi:cell filamentation protein